jgi:hypothetical protein
VLGVVGLVEEQQFHALRIAAEEAEVRAVRGDRRPQGMSATGI